MARRAVECQGWNIGDSACIVCHHVTKEGFPILYACRDEPVEEADSGWQFHCDQHDHSEAWSAVWAVANAIDFDSSIAAIIDSPVGSAYQRESVTDEWISVPYGEAIDESDGD